jgi:hypothetical protein
LRFEAALKQEVSQALHQFVEVDGICRLSYIFSVLDDLHSVALRAAWVAVRRLELRSFVAMLLRMTTLRRVVNYNSGAGG